MGRNAKERRSPAPRPVEKVEVNERHIGRRTVLFFVCLTVALTSLGYGVYMLLSAEPGWTRIESGGSGFSTEEDFTFEYLVSQGGLSGSDELRQVRGLYTQLLANAHMLFSADVQLKEPDVHNMWYINSHPNEEIEVDPLLYQAFSMLEEAGNRGVYLGPVYELYTDLFFAQDAHEAALLDPWQDPDMGRFCQEAADYAQSPNQVNVELLGENRLCLRVSEEYRRFVEENGATKYVDFYRQKNAFILDYFVEELAKAGFQEGVLSSADGCVRCLPGTSAGTVFNLLDWRQDQAVAAAQAPFDQPVALVYMRSFPVGERDQGWYQPVEEGVFRHPYVDIADGRCRAAARSLAVYAPKGSCAQLMLAAEPVFIAQDLDLAALSGCKALAVTGESQILSTDKEQRLENIYKGYSRKDVP